jgi:hypothetical protein
MKGLNSSVKDTFVDITRLIRSIQRSEGNRDCFGTANGHCDYSDCAWRPYCLKESEQEGNRPDKGDIDINGKRKR